MEHDLERLVRVRQLGLTGAARRIREQANVSLRDLAAEVGHDPATVLRWERGARPRKQAALQWDRALRRLAREIEKAEQDASFDPASILAESPEGLTALSLGRRQSRKATPSDSDVDAARSALESLVRDCKATCRRGRNGQADIFLPVDELS